MMKHYLLVILLVVSWSCQGQFWRQIHPGKLLFKEDFEGQVDLSQYLQHGGKTGQWVVKDGKLSSGPMYVGWLTLPAAVHGKNIAFQANVRITEAAEPTRWCSIFARQGDPAKQLFVQMPLRQNLWTEIADSIINADTGNCEWKVYNATPYRDKKPLDAMRTMRLELRDNIASTFIDGHCISVAKLVPDNIIDGRCGFMVCCATMEIDNIQIEELPVLKKEEMDVLKELSVGRPIIIGHRGNSVDFPENTLASYVGAIGTGADGVEIDVRLSKDGIPYSFHDDTLDRTTTGKGRVSDYTMAELQSFDAGVKRDKKFAGEKIPTFEEIIQATKGKLMILIDLKESKAIPAMCDLMQKYDIVDTTIIAPWSERDVVEIRKRIPNATVMLLGGTINGEQKNFNHLHALGFDGVFISLQTVMNFPTYRPRSKCMTTYVWTVNSPSSVTAAWKLGVDGIVTDNPRMVRQKVEELMEKVDELK